MSRALARRIAKLEDSRRPPVIVPHVAEQRHDETTEQAIARFRDHFGDAIPKRHAVLFVPTWPTFDAFAAALKAHQTALLEWVSVRHPKETEQC